MILEFQPDFDGNFSTAIMTLLENSIRINQILLDNFSADYNLNIWQTMPEHFSYDTSGKNPPRHLMEYIS
jgi:hypothetical protein